MAFDLSSLNGTNGFRLEGINDGDASGFSVAGAGDVNGDGIADFIIAAPGANSALGESYVVFGSTAPFASSVNLGALHGTMGFRLDGFKAGIYSDFLDATSVAGAGDINGDGIDDLIIGDAGFDYNTGASFVVFGSTVGFAPAVDLATLDGDTGFRLNGVGQNDRSGHSVDGVGDVNGDGIDDVIVGAPKADSSLGGSFYSGESYIVFGSTSGFAPSLDLASLDGENGFAVVGFGDFAYSGISVAGAGDINGDAIDDLVIAAPNAESNTGASYVVFGTTAGFAAKLDLATLDGNNGFALNVGDYGCPGRDPGPALGDCAGKGCRRRAPD